MSEEIKEKRYSEDEIDLRAVFAAIGNFFKSIGNAIIYSIITFRTTTKKYRALIFVFILIGSLLSVGYNYVSKPFYESSLLLDSEYFNGRLIENAIDKLNRSRGSAELPELLNIPEEVAEEIVGFESEPFVDEEEVTELEVLKTNLNNLNASEEEINRIINRVEIENRKTFEITVRVSDYEIIPLIEEPLVNYFKNSPYIKKRIEINKINLKLEEEKIENEISQIDSLQNALFDYIQNTAARTREGSNNVVLSDPTLSDPINVFREDMNLYRDKLEVQKSLYLEDDFEVIDGLTAYQKPASADLTTMIGTGVLISIGISYLLIIFIELNKYLDRVEQRRLQSREV